MLKASLILFYEYIYIYIERDMPLGEAPLYSGLLSVWGATLG